MKKTSKFDEAKKQFEILRAPYKNTKQYEEYLEARKKGFVVKRPKYRFEYCKFKEKKSSE